MKTENTNPLSAIPFRHWLIMLTFIFFACTSDSGNSWNAEDVCPESDRGYFTDHRDGREYKYTTIGDQVWMAENLNYTTENSECSEYIENYCDIYGRLYSDWTTADTVCPPDWHLPSKAEWEELIETMGGKKNINKGVLRAREGWFRSVGDEFVADTTGVDLCGFAALPGGGGGEADFFYNKTATYWLTATQPMVYRMTKKDNVFWNSRYLNSIRCVKDK